MNKNDECRKEILKVLYKYNCRITDYNSAYIEVWVSDRDVLDDPSSVHLDQNLLKPFDDGE